MKPDWKDAPKWANWLAMDEDGEWCWYQDEPTQGNRMWDIYDDRFDYALVLGNEPDWRKTLEKRPNE